MAYTEVEGSEKQVTHSTGAVRSSCEGSGRFDLLPVYALTRLAQHFENGAKRYSDENWRKGLPLRRYLDSALRHTFKFLEGQRNEDHLAAAAWNILACIETEHQIDVGNLPRTLDNLPDWTPQHEPGLIHPGDQPARIRSGEWVACDDHGTIIGESNG
jgi:hypothetical protein